MDCAKGCSRFLLCLFNFFFWLSGVVIIIVGVIAYNSKNLFSSYKDLHHGALFLIGFGIFVFMVGILGCCAAYTGNYCMLMSFSIIMIVIFLAEVVFFIGAFIVKSSIEDKTAERIELMTKNYYKNEEVARYMDFLQFKLECCGSSGPGDYKSRPIPRSCCEKLGSKTCSKSQAYTKGCSAAAKTVWEKAFNMTTATIIGIAFGHLLVIVCACIYASWTKRQQEQYEYKSMHV